MNVSGIRRVLVIGNGMVGHHFATELRAVSDAAITIIGAEPRPAYDRVHLSSVFAGARPEDLAMGSRDGYAEQNIEAHFGDAVAAIHRDRKVVVTELGREFGYDKLVLATGSYPFVPPLKGADLAHCHAYRTIDDLGAIRASAKDARTGVVVGGGLLGLEAANALRNLGLETHVVEVANRLMGVQLDGDGARMLQQQIEALGIRVHLSKLTEEIVAGRETRLTMRFNDGVELGTDVIVFSAGIRPEDALARAAGLEVGERGGIVVDQHCRTSDADVLAVGECALFGGRIFGLVAPGYRMAEVAVSHLTGGDATFQGADMSTKLKLLGVDVGSIGDAHGATVGARSCRFSDERAGVYKKIVTSADGKRLLGAVLVGDAGDYGILQQMMLNGLTLPEQPESLILPRLDGEGLAATSLDALPDSAQICSCHNVSKGDLVGAVAGGCQTVAALKADTKAGTGCGGCVPMVTGVLNAELSKLGIAVNTDLCEHFPHTRQELYHIVRVEKITTFSELVAKHGRGRGCDVCKPAVASILASCWNGHVLEDSHAPLQDTNDHFLANLQKDGTYSVVPRVPGGEITPDKLIVLGQVAKQYGLYTKITGGQRIDLFGAQVHELPQIWRALIDAGFETGHAYGKALRTVKSCVGSTWCRYGVLDSVGMAIQVESRYKGLRSPHKLKMAVSGCTRECAEAQSKDVGVIATEHGWNLYVCGNGGMRPRHADLFATGLDDDTLIRYIDRFLMFYVRTADRLQRTSVWLENLEGGLDYLKAVVIDDSLGICDELEREMQQVIGTYQCEWKTAIEDEDKLRRFRTFVNSDDADPNLAYVAERGQRRPARDEERLAVVELT